MYFLKGEGGCGDKDEIPSTEHLKDSCWEVKISIRRQKRKSINQIKREGMGDQAPKSTKIILEAQTDQTTEKHIARLKPPEQHSRWLHMHILGYHTTHLLPPWKDLCWDGWREPDQHLKGQSQPFYEFILGTWKLCQMVGLYGAFRFHVCTREYPSLVARCAFVLIDTPSAAVSHLQPSGQHLNIDWETSLNTCL